MNYSLIIKLVILVASAMMLIAPFTFLKPITDVSTSTPIESEEVAKKATVKTTPKKVVVEEKPLHSVVLPDFRSIVDVKEKKRQFFAFIRPSVEQENDKILELREQLLTIVDKLSLEDPLSEHETALLKTNAKKYKVSGQYSQLYQAHQLLLKVDIIPTELVLVQAANESAWGTSRFARIGLNYFGIWCYRKGCGMVPSGRNEGARHEVAAFDSVDHAVERYLFNINTNNAYQVFRTIRAQLRSNEEELAPEILATGLLPYSERGIDYVLELTEMIRHNQDYFVESD
ncbi:glucosaminidase domain-containing protein [Thalassotalea sp. PLHSN55]|uniref:glucosaminidase domain-containing protein n=1 Tax=Thalassotalea sp. PLHSN55 TaxID=3435888 RepID=UPI003F836A48